MISILFSAQFLERYDINISFDKKDNFDFEFYVMLVLYSTIKIKY
jgi:hypothetical protein